MDINFSRIENYINKKLSKEEKDRFEAELKTDRELAERYHFYKNLKKESSPEIKPLEFNKKILPEINDINFTEKKHKKGISKGTAAGIVALFIAVSGYLLLSNISQSRNIVQMQSIILDSIKVLSVQVAGIESDSSKTSGHEMLDTVNVLQKLITAKENEIALLKHDNKDKEVSKDEVVKLKQELARLKQEYYENSGVYAAENASNKELDDFVKSIDIFVSKPYKVKVKWVSNDKFRVSMYNYKNGNEIYSSKGSIKNTFTTAIPEYGFYIITFKAVGKKEIKMLVSLKENMAPEVFLKK